MVIPGRIPNSRRALEASEYAREQGKHDDFHRVVFQKFYGEGQDMSDWAVLRAAAEEVELDSDEMQQKTDGGDYKTAVDEKFNTARMMVITGVPAYILGDKYAIIGAQPYEVFQQTMTRLKAENGD